jgi:DNA-binding NarL/FixJ family response regulator
MPLKDGFAVLEEIRADPAIEHIPVIILTAARLDPVEIQSGLNMGADDYVTKPFDRKELLARIRTKLRVKQAEDVIRRRNRELNLLPEIGKDLSARLNIEELATVLLKRTGETLGAMLGHVVILDSKGIYQKTYSFANSSAHDQALQYSLPSQLLEIVNNARQGFIIDDTHRDPRWEARKTSTRITSSWSICFSCRLFAVRRALPLKMRSSMTRWRRSSSVFLRFFRALPMRSSCSIASIAFRWSTLPRRNYSPITRCRSGSSSRKIAAMTD